MPAATENSASPTSIGPSLAIRATAAIVDCSVDEVHAVLECKPPDARPRGEAVGVGGVDLDTGERNPLPVAAPVREALPCELRRHRHDPAQFEGHGGSHGKVNLEGACGIP